MTTAILIAVLMFVIFGVIGVVVFMMVKKLTQRIRTPARKRTSPRRRISCHSRTSPTT